MLKILTNNRLFFIVFLLWLIIGALFQVFFTQTEIMFWINEHHSKALDVLFKYATLLGEDTIFLGLFLCFAFMHYVQESKKSFEMKFLLAAWLVKVIVSVSLKNIFNLPRPMEVYQHLGREIHLVEGITIHHWQSFPSGHTMTAFAFACFIAIVFKQPKWGILMLFIAILVGFSRMYLFQHFPRDVFAGSIFGVGIPPALKGANYFLRKSNMLSD
jgi:membrane-associated phospholipid phosphatase